MPHAFLVLLLLATLFRTLSVATGEVGSIWDPDGNTVLSTVKERYAELVLPYA